MKKIYLVLILTCQLVALAANGQVLSFKAWKNQQVRDAEQTLKKAKIANRKDGAADLLYQALLKVELSKDLTVNDYFLVYLSRHKDGKGAILQAAKKMSPEETASLLMAYRNSLQQNSELSPQTKPQDQLLEIKDLPISPQPVSPSLEPAPTTPSNLPASAAVRN